MAAMVAALRRCSSLFSMSFRCCTYSKSIANKSCSSFCRISRICLFFAVSLAVLFRTSSISLSAFAFACSFRRRCSSSDHFSASSTRRRSVSVAAFCSSFRRCSSAFNASSCALSTSLMPVTCAVVICLETVDDRLLTVAI